MTYYVLHVNRFLKTHSRMNAVLDDAPEVWPTLIAWLHKSKKSMIKWKKLDPEPEINRFLLRFSQHVYQIV